MENQDIASKKDVSLFLKLVFCLLLLVITTICSSQNNSTTEQFTTFDAATLSDTAWLNIVHRAIRTDNSKSKILEKSAEEALVVAKNNKDNSLIARAYSDLCFLFAKNQNATKFYEYIDTAIEYCENTKNLKDLANIYFNKGRFHQRFGPLSILPELSTKTIELGKRINDYKTIFHGYTLKGDIYAWAGTKDDLLQSI